MTYLYACLLSKDFKILNKDIITYKTCFYKFIKINISINAYFHLLIQKNSPRVIRGVSKRLSSKYSG